MQADLPNIIEKLRFNEKGLIPAISQDWLDGTILMMAWMNREALELTIQSREVHYWSRSRNEIWHKGATSGHTQTLKGIRYDCDADVLLLNIQQVGDTACHTGARSCFLGENEFYSEGGPQSKDPPSDGCTELFKVIQQRYSSPEEGSYTNELLEGGENKILKKVGEESAEFIMACKDKDSKSIANEAADLIFHIQVALASNEVNWRDVLRVLVSRRGAPRRNQISH